MCVFGSQVTHLSFPLKFCFVSLQSPKIFMCHGIYSGAVPFLHQEYLYGTLESLSWHRWVINHGGNTLEDIEYPQKIISYWTSLHENDCVSSEEQGKVFWCMTYFN